MPKLREVPPAGSFSNRSKLGLAQQQRRPSDQIRVEDSSIEDDEKFSEDSDYEEFSRGHDASSSTGTGAGNDRSADKQRPGTQQTAYSIFARLVRFEA